MTPEVAGGARDPKSEGYRVAIVGASSLLGKEVAALLKERQFAVASLMEIEAGLGAELEPELPIVDLDKGDPGESALTPPVEVPGDELDIAFLAVRLDPLPLFLRPESTRPALIIDLDANLAELREAIPRVAWLEGETLPATVGPGETAAFLSAHPATMVLSSVLLRLASRVEIRAAVAHIFTPASDLGARGIDELQRQTVNLLSFQKTPRAVFGSQLAFNLLPRLTGSGSEALGHIEDRLRREVERYLQGRVPLPALKVFQAPVFYSLAASLYVETAEILTPREAGEAVSGEGVRLCRASEAVPSPVEATGGGDVLIDSIVADSNRAQGLWIWAAADNLRLAARNAVEIAARYTGQARTAESGRAAQGRRPARQGRLR